MSECVFCLVCGKRWDAINPGVLYRSEDGQWWCADETACAESRAAQGVPDGVLFTEQARASLAHAFGQMRPMRPGK
jgi:hypothetical protein